MTHSRPKPPNTLKTKWGKLGWIPLMKLWIVLTKVECPISSKYNFTLFYRETNYETNHTYKQLLFPLKNSNLKYLQNVIMCRVHLLKTMLTQQRGPSCIYQRESTLETTQWISHVRMLIRMDQHFIMQWISGYGKMAKKDGFHIRQKWMTG